MSTEITGDNEILTMLDVLGNVTPLLNDIGRRMTEDSKMNFRLSRGPDGSAWAPLKSRVGKPLVDTRRLRNSITSDVNEALKLVRIGTNVEYAKVHNEGFNGSVNVGAHTRRIKQVFGRPIDPKTIDIGAHIRNMNVPARPFLGFAERQERLLDRSVTNWVESIINA